MIQYPEPFDGYEYTDNFGGVHTWNTNVVPNVEKRNHYLNTQKQKHVEMVIDPIV